MARILEFKVYTDRQELEVRVGRLFLDHGNLLDGWDAARLDRFWNRTRGRLSEKRLRELSLLDGERVVFELARSG